MYVSVIGGSTVTDAEYTLARQLGRKLGKRGHTVVCGGLGGVMEAVCLGVSETDGHTIGILPGRNREAANDYVETAIATGMGNARNVVVVRNGAGIIAVDGSIGTLSELGHALDFGKPVAGLETHRIDGVDGIEHVDTPEEAVAYVERSVD